MLAFRIALLALSACAATTYGPGYVSTHFEELGDDGVVHAIETQPLAGRKHQLTIAYSQPARELHVEVCDVDGRRLHEVAATWWMDGANDESLWTTELTPPLGPFQLYLRGKTSTGTKFRHVANSELVGQHVHLVLPPGTTHDGGTRLDWKVELRNDGPDDTFEVTLEPHDVTLLTPRRHELGLARGRTHTLRFTMHLPVSTHELEHGSIAVYVRSLSEPALATSAKTSFVIR